MFTGLIETTGVVARVERDNRGAILTIETPLAGDLSQGSSIAVNGVCLTAIDPAPTSFKADVMAQTLRSSGLGELNEGDHVNLERPMQLGERLDGHIVQGHVDGIGRITAVEQEGFSSRVTIEPPPGLLRYMADKGSITVNGISLTIAGLDDNYFTVSLIPETQQRTNLGNLQPGSAVNLEVDVLAKYVERLLTPRTDA